MYISKSKTKYGTYYISIAKGIRDPETKKVKKIMIKSFGTHDLESKEGKKALQLAEKELKEMQRLEDAAKGFKSFEDFMYHTKDNLSTRDVKIGYLPYLQLYKKLKLPTFFNQLSKDYKMDYSFSDMMFFQVLGRLFYPASKLELVNRKKDYLYDFSFVNKNNIYSSMDVFSGFNKYKTTALNENKKTIDDMVDLLSTVDEESKKILEKNIDNLVAEVKTIKDDYNKTFEKTENKLFKHLNKNISKMIKEREMSLAFYDCTTYYFESFIEDELREKGMSKDNKRNETQVVMGLLIDTNGIPISYKLFRGNLHELDTMEQVVDDVLNNYTIKDIIIVADRGLNSKKNMRMLRDKGLNYIVGTKSNCVPKEIQEKTFNDSWHQISRKKDGYQSGYTTGTREIVDVDKKTGEKTSTTELIIKKYSDLYKNQQLHKQEESIRKAQKKMKDFTAENGAKSKSRYYKVSDNPKSKIVVEIDEERIEKERESFGYFYIITNKKEMDPIDIIKAYSSLYKIEESFRVLKSNLKARPVYHFIDRRIRVHFLICYVALVLERILEYQLRMNNSTLSTNNILEELGNFRLNEINYGVGSFYMIPDNMFESLVNKKILKFDKKVYMTINDLTLDERCSEF